MKLLLYLYEIMSGLQINFAKSEVILIHGDEVKYEQMAGLFNCQIGCFPIKYLGVPVSPSNLHVKDWSLREEKMKKANCLERGTMSIAGRTTLINSSLSSTIISYVYVLAS
jgi:hypothetical protein